MKKVEFVRIKSHIDGFGLGKGVKYTFEDYREKIEEYLEKGWDYCGYVPVKQRGTGDIEEIDLIFTKEKK